MNKKDLFNYNEKDLPNVTLTENQKAKIKKSLFNNIKRFNENNYTLPIDNSLENIKAIEDKLGTEKDDVIHGVKHAKVLKELAIQAVQKDCPLNDSAILYKNLFQIGYGMEAKDATYSYVYSTFYCYIFITKDFLVTYSFDNFYRLQHKHFIKLSDIKDVKISDKAHHGIKLSRDNLIISIHHTARENVSTFYLVNCSSKKDDIKEAKNLLVSLGVTESTIPFNHSIQYYLYFVIWIVFAFYFLGFMISH